MQDGVVENFTAGPARPLPRRLRLPRPATAASASSTRSRCAEHVTELDAARLPGALPRARRPGGARVPRRDRGRARRATAATAAGTTSPTCRWSHPADVPRFAALGAAATIQPLWAAHEPQMDDLTIPFLGERPVGPAVPVRRPGRGRRAPGRRQRLAGEQPGPAARACTSRSTGSCPARAAPRPSRCHPATGSTSATALTAYTAGSAWVNHLDDATGRLAAGLLADLAVLDRDPFAGPPEEIGATRVVATYLAGETRLPRARLTEVAAGHHRDELLHAVLLRRERPGPGVLAGQAALHRLAGRPVLPVGEVPEVHRVRRVEAGPLARPPRGTARRTRSQVRSAASGVSRWVMT